MYNRNINRLTAVIQSPIAPRSTNVLWDDLVSNTLKVYRKGIWTVIGGAGGGGEGSSLYWGYDDIQGVIFPLDNRSVQINGDLTVNGTIKTFGLEINGKPFEQYWELDSNTNTLSTTYKVLIKNSLIVEQDASSGGEGQDTPGGGGLDEEQLQDYLDLHKYITEDALSSYYTKAESDARYLASSLLGSNTLIHSGNIGSYAMKWMGGAKTGADANSYSYDAGVFGVASGANMPTASGYGAILNIPYRVGSGKPDFMGQLMMPNGDEGDLSLYYRTSLADTWNPWRKIIATADDGYLYGLGGSIDIQYGDEINRYGGNLYLQHRGGSGATGSGTGGTTTGHILMCAYGGNVGIGTTSPTSKLDVHGSVAVNEYLVVRAWTGYGTGTCNMWYSGTANTLEISSSVKTMHDLTVTDNLTVNGFAESTYNRNTGMASNMYFTSTQWLRIWKGTYGSAVRLQIGKNYYHMDPMVLCVDVSVGYSSAAISVTCNADADAANMAIQAIRVTKDASGNYNIDVLIYNAVVNTDTFRVCGNSALGHIVAFETADNSATVLEQISVVPNASIISNNLIVAGDVASA